MKIKHMFILLAASVSTASCGFLDEYDPNATTVGNFYKSEADIVTSLNGVYASLTQSYYYTVSYTHLDVYKRQQLALADDRPFLEIDLDDLARSLEREVHLFVRQQVADHRNAVGEGLRTHDESVHVQNALLPGRAHRGRIGVRSGGAGAEVSVNAQHGTKYDEDNGRNDPFLSFIHCSE